MDTWRGEMARRRRHRRKWSNEEKRGNHRSNAGARSSVSRLPKLRPSLDNGRLEADNNNAERGTRGVAVGHKNWLFAGSEGGGKAAAIALHPDRNGEAERHRPAGRAEASHRHTRRREKALGRFKSPGQVQRLLSAHDQIAVLFRPKRHRLSARSYRQARTDAFSLWSDYTAALTA